MIVVQPTANEAAESLAPRHRPCPGCGGRSFVAVVHEPVLCADAHVARCSHCGFLTTMLARDFTWDEAYPPSYREHCGDCEHALRDRPRRGRRFPRPFGNRRLLDVGCGAGKYLLEMRRLGWQTLGVERSPVATAAAQSAGLAVRGGDFLELDFGAERFDLITCWQTLEHFPQPDLVLQRIAASLAPGGRLLAAVPNAASGAAAWFGPYWIGWDLPRHLAHFTPLSLSNLATAAGLRVVALRGDSHSGWIRHSARRMHFEESQHRTTRLLTTRFLSRLVAAAWLVAGRADGIFLEAAAR